MRNLNTALDLISSKGTVISGVTVDVKGYSTAGDGGEASWKFNGVTGQTPSQSPAQLGDALINDASGNQWELALHYNYIDSRILGAVADGVADDRSAIIACDYFSKRNKIYTYVHNCYIDEKLNLTGSIKGIIVSPSSAISDHIVEYDSQSDFFVSLEVDGKSTDNGNKALINVKECSSFLVIKSNAKDAYSIGISVVGGSSGVVQECKANKLSPSGSYVNIGINVSDASSVPSNIQIINNETEGFDIQVRGKRCKVIGNTVKNWMYGGGLTFTQPPLGLEANYGEHEIYDNTVFGSSGIDVDNTPPAGVECSQQSCKIKRNVLFDCAGEGIVSASTNSEISSNVIFNCGRELTAPNGSRDGIHLRSLPAATGNDQHVFDNHCYDTRVDGSKTQLLGLRVNNGLERTKIGINYLDGNENGRYSLPTDKLYEIQDIRYPVKNFSGNKTISGGEITADSGSFQVDTEAGAASDDLETIFFPDDIDGAEIVVGLVSAARQVTVKNGVGNIRLSSGDVTLTGQFSILRLYYRSGFWLG